MADNKTKPLKEVNREVLIAGIIQNVLFLGINKLEGWNIDFRNINEFRNTSLLRHELENMQEELVYRVLRKEKDLKRAPKKLKEESFKEKSRETKVKKENSPKAEFFKEKFQTVGSQIEKQQKGVSEEGFKIEKFQKTKAKKENAQKAVSSKEKAQIVSSQKEKQQKVVSEEASYVRPDYQSDFPIVADESWRNSIPDIAKQSVRNWRTIKFEKMVERIKELKAQSTNREQRDELDDYLCELEDYMMFEDEEEDYFDPLEIIARYQNGAIKEEEVTQTDDDKEWRLAIPKILRNQIEDWNTISLDDFYDQAKDLINSVFYQKENKQVVFEFIIELSQIIFERKNAVILEEEEQEDKELSDTDAESIMSLVEMIILPRLEAIDKLAKTGGKVKYANLWNVPFTDELKDKVKERDGWKCVVCEHEADLHVHHKIPRNLGGIHHMNNLVTLCSSCHPAIETGDIQKSYKKCLANYNKNKFNSRFRKENLSRDKQLLKEEVQQGLDALLLELNRRDELRLMENLIGIMNRLDVIFYE